MDWLRARDPDPLALVVTRPVPVVQEEQVAGPDSRHGDGLGGAGREGPALEPDDDLNGARANRRGGRPNGAFPFHPPNDRNSPSNRDSTSPSRKSNGDIAARPADARAAATATPGAARVATNMQTIATLVQRTTDADTSLPPRSRDGAPSAREMGRHARPPLER